MMDAAQLSQLFGAARTTSRWQDRAVPDSLLHALYAHMKFGPTSANCSPARLVFVKSAAQKAALLACVSEGNREQTRLAPVCAIVGMDMAFYEQLPYLFPHTDARAWFAGKPGAIETTAMRNSSLQGGYLIMAARALGLDCGPMSGFNAAQVNAHFFAGSAVKVNFLCNLGYGDPQGQHPRLPRLEFAQVCSVV